MILTMDTNLSQPGSSIVELFVIGAGVLFLIAACEQVARKDWGGAAIAGSIGGALIWFCYTFGPTLRAIADHQLGR